MPIRQADRTKSPTRVCASLLLTPWIRKDHAFRKGQEPCFAFSDEIVAKPERNGNRARPTDARHALQSVTLPSLVTRLGHRSSQFAQSPSSVVVVSFRYLAGLNDVSDASFSPSALPGHPSAASVAAKRNASLSIPCLDPKVGKYPARSRAVYPAARCQFVT